MSCELVVLCLRRSSAGGSTVLRHAAGTEMSAARRLPRNGMKRLVRRSAATPCGVNDKLGNRARCQPEDYAGSRSRPRCCRRIRGCGSLTGNRTAVTSGGRVRTFRPCGFPRACCASAGPTAESTALWARSSPFRTRSD